MFRSVSTPMKRWIDALAARMNRRDRRRQAAVCPSRRKAPLGLEELEQRETPSAAPMIVASTFDSALYELDPTTGNVLKTIVAPYTYGTPTSAADIFAQPSGITFGSDGNLYITVQGDYTPSSQYGPANVVPESILQYNFATNTLSTFIGSNVLDGLAGQTGGFFPQGVAFGPDGNLYVSSAGTGDVFRFAVTNSGGVLTYNSAVAPFPVADNMLAPAGLAFGTNAGDTTSLYIADYGDDNIVQVQNATAATPPAPNYTFINGAAVGVESPTGVTWSGGDLYIADIGAAPPNFQGNVFQYNPTTMAIQAITQQSGSGDLVGQFPSSVAFDSQGNLYTANLGGGQHAPLFGQINEYSVSGGSATFLATPVSSSQSQYANTGTDSNGNMGVGISPAQILFFSAPGVATNPANLEVAAAQTATFTAVSSGGPTVTDQWQVNTGNGSGFINLANGGAYSGVTTSTLTIADPTVNISGYQFRDVFTNVLGSTNTNGATLSVVAPLVVASNEDSALYEFDPATSRLLNTIVPANVFSSSTSAADIFGGPASFAFGPDGNLYISVQGIYTTSGTTTTTVVPESILQYNFTTNTLSTFIPNTNTNGTGLDDLTGGPGDFSPDGLAFGPDGNLYVVSAGAGAVGRFAITHTAGVLSYNSAVTPVALAPGMNFPGGLTFGTNAGDTGNLYVADSGDGNIVQITNATSSSPGVFYTYINGASAGLAFPAGVTWSGGDLYIADELGEIFQYNPSTATTVPITPQTGAGDLSGQYPRLAAFDGHGHMFTANLGANLQPNLNGSIDEYTTAGAFVQTLVSSSEFPNTGTDSTGQTTSGISPVTLIFSSAPVVTTNPTSSTINVGQPTSFTAAGNGVPAVTVQWQVNTGSGFTNLSDGGVYSGSATTTLTITGATAGMSGYTYRAVFTNFVGSTATTAATLTVNSTQPPALAGLPVVNGSNAVINIVSATGNGTTATITTDGTAHGFWVGELVTLTGTTPGGPGGLAGTFTVTGVPSATSFQFASTYNGSETFTGAKVFASLAGVQRSMVDSIVYNFTAPVNLTAAAFTITAIQNSPGSTVGVVPTVNVAAVPFTNEWVVTFTDPVNFSVTGNSIANGAYTIAINPADVTAVSGGENLVAGETDTFYRLYGDVTGVQSVKNVDANAFNRAWGNFYYSFNFNAALDFNADGKYTNIDANAFNRAFNTRYSVTTTI